MASLAAAAALGASAMSADKAEGSRMSCVDFAASPTKLSTL